MRPILLFTIGLTSALKETDASSISDVKERHESIHQYRRLKNQQKHLQKIDLDNWIEKEEEGEEIHLVELQLRPQYTSDVGNLKLAKMDEINPASLRCLPNSCKGTLDKYCENCQMSFCMTNHHLMSENPFKYVKYDDITDTEHCEAQSVTWDINEIYQELHDEDESDAKCRSLPVEMAIFDMGGTDSDRISSVLAGLDPSVYVVADAQPLNEALSVCSNKRKELLRTEPCSSENVIDLVEKTGYLMCRTCDPTYEHCVLKFSPGSTLDMEIFKEAFKKADVSFIYTEPSIYMGSVVDPKRPEKAKCAYYKYNPTNRIKETALKQGKEISEMSVEEICAMEARNIMESAITERGRSGKVNFMHADDALDKIVEIAHDVLKLKPEIEFINELKGKSNPQRYESHKQELLEDADENMIVTGEDYLGQYFEKAEVLAGFLG